MPQLEFRCVNCGNPFSVPSSAIPAAGGRGRCTACGKALAIFPDGRILDGGLSEQRPAQPQAPPAAPPQKPPIAPENGAVLDQPVWRFRPPAGLSQTAEFRPYRLSELEKLVLEAQISEDTMASVMEGDWQPASSFPALMALFSRRAAQDRELHGDAEHCAHHKDRVPGWRCVKCKNYLCAQCVVNRPVMAGGSPNYLCAGCEVDVEALKGKGALRTLGNLFKK